MSEASPQNVNRLKRAERHLHVPRKRPSSPFGSTLRALAIFFALLGPAQGADGEKVSDEAALHAILAHAAWVQAAAGACGNETPEVSGHLIQVYDDWSKRNPVIREAINALESGPDAEQAAKNRNLFDRLKTEAESIFAAKRESDPDFLTRECDAFIKELADGEWDYPRRGSSPR